MTKDYLDNLNLLNAYKHGYRVSAKHDKMILSLGIKDGKHYKLDESDSSITYFSKGKYDNNVAIFSNTINFKISRIFGKSLFVGSLLNNMRAVILLRYKEKVDRKNVATFSINDEQSWNKTFGESHIKAPVFSLQKKSK